MLACLNKKIVEKQFNEIFVRNRMYSKVFHEIDLVFYFIIFLRFQTSPETKKGKILSNCGQGVQNRAPWSLEHIGAQV